MHNMLWLKTWIVEEIINIADQLIHRISPTLKTNSLDDILLWNAV